MIMKAFCKACSKESYKTIEVDIIEYKSMTETVKILLSDLLNIYRVLAKCFNLKNRRFLTQIQIFLVSRDIVCEREKGQ